MSADPDIRLLFIIGSGRCGSSLVHELLAKHREVGFISNLDDNFPLLDSKGSFNNALFRSVLGNRTRKGGLRFAPSEAYRLIGKKVSPLYANSCRNLTAADVTPQLKQSFRDFFLERLVAQSKPLFIHKYTGWSRVAFFREIFPEALFVHIVRDGRAVANSFLQMPWWTGFRGPGSWYLGPLNDDQQARWEASQRSFAVLAGLAWEILVDSVEADAAQLATRGICTLRYEDFLHDPVARLRRLCDFAALEFDSDFENRVRRRHIDPGREQAFIRDLSAPQVEALTASLAAPLNL